MREARAGLLYTAHGAALFLRDGPRVLRGATFADD